MNKKSSALRASATQAGDLLKKLAHPARLMIVCQLLEGEQSVGALAQQAGLRSSTTSQHLAQLKADGIVAPRREGQTVYYRVVSVPARAVIRALAAHYCKEEE